MKKALLVCAVFVVAAFSSLAVEYPDQADDFVNDFGKVISEADTGRIRSLLDNIDSQAGVHITVTTINSLADYRAEASLRDYAAQLFDRWGVGDSRKNNGIMILFSSQDREVWIEAGLGYNNRYNAEFQEVVDTDMLPYFREGNYSRGLYEGVLGVSRVVTSQVSWLSYYKWELILSALAVACVFAGISCMKSGKKGWGYTFFAVAGILLLFVLKHLLSGKGGGRGGRSGGGGAGGRW